MPHRDKRPTRDSLCRGGRHSPMGGTSFEGTCTFPIGKSPASRLEASDATQDFRVEVSEAYSASELLREGLRSPSPLTRVAAIEGGHTRGGGEEESGPISASRSSQIYTGRRGQDSTCCCFGSSFSLRAASSACAHSKRVNYLPSGDDLRKL